LSGPTGPGGWGVALAAGGAWVAGDGPRLTRVDAAALDRVSSAEPPAAPAPRALRLVVASDGALFTAGDDRIRQHDPRTGAVLKGVGIGQRVAPLAPAPHGLHVLGAGRQLVRFDPRAPGLDVLGSELLPIADGEPR